MPAGTVAVDQPPAPELGGPRRADVLAAWQQGLTRRGLQPTTVRQWVYIVRGWWVFVGDERVWRPTRRDVERFMDKGSPGPEHARTRVMVLHAFYRWSQRERLCRRDPTLDVERPKVSPRLPRPIADSDLALAVMLAPPVIRAAVLLGATSGLRCIELARLRWDDVDERSIRVHGKGNRWRVVPIHPDARDALTVLDRRQDGFVFPGTTPNTHPSLIGKRMSHMLRDYLHGLGINASAHQLRHWFATKALERCDNLRAVQELLGHAGPNTTAIYTRLDPARLAPIVRSIEVPGMPGRAAPHLDSMATARAAIAETAAAAGRVLDVDELATLSEQLLDLVQAERAAHTVSRTAP